FGFAEPHCVLRDGIEDRLQVEAMSADDFQHLARRGLLLKRYGEVGRALTQFVEQSCVLDGHDCLRGEVLHQLDLLFAKGADLLTVHYDCTDQFVLLQHRDGDKCSYTADFDGGSDLCIELFSVERLCRQIGNMDDCSGRHQTTQRIVRIGKQRQTAAKIKEGRRRIVRCSEVQGLTVPAKYI